jgi:thiol-disulfide isomerase/thioredoxin
MRNLAKAQLGLLVGMALGASLGCEREVPRKVAPAVAASTPPPEAPALQSAQTTSQQPPGSDPALPRATASQLLSSVAAAGKKATLINVWATWCGPCRRELPMLQALSVNLKPQRVDVILVSVDDAKDEAKAASYLKDNGIALKTYMVDGSLADFKAGINPSWPGMLPASFLFDASARLVHFWGGEAFENEIAPVVDDFLAGRPVAPETRYGLAPGKQE